MAEKKIKLSFIVPVYNRHKLLIKCLSNIKKQNNRYEYEIVIVDDASNPPIHTVISKFIKDFKNIKIIVNKKNVGPATSRNLGFKKSVGQYICFLDSDDLLPNNFINNVIKCIDQNNSPAIISKMRPSFIGENTLKNTILYSIRHYSRVLIFLYMNLFNRKVLPIDFFYMTRLSGMVFNRKYIKDIKFDKNYKSAEDWKYILDTYKKNGEFYVSICNTTLVIYTHHIDTETLGRSGYYVYYRKLIKSIPIRISNNIGIRIFKMYSNYEK